MNGNLAADGSGGITRDATGAEENATIVNINESPIRAGILYVGTDDGKVWLTRNDGSTWEDLSDHFPGAPPMSYISKIDASHFDSATVYVTRDNHRENDFTPYVYVSTDWGKTFKSITSNLPNSGAPSSAYVIREDPVNPNLLYVGTETGVFASLNKGQSWFPLNSGLPTVPVFDLQIHPRDHELIAATHGRAIWIADVAPLQQMSTEVLAKSTHLFAPTVALQYAQMIVASEPRSQRQWKGEGGPSGAEIVYRLSAAATGTARVLIVNAAGDTIARLTGGTAAGINKVTWNLAASPGGAPGGGGMDFAAFGGGAGGGRGGRGGFSDTTQVAGFPRGFNPRPAEASGAPDTTGSPSAVKRALETPAAAGGAGGRGGRGGGGGGGGFGGRGAGTVETGNYRVVLDVGGQKLTTVLRVVEVAPGNGSVMTPFGW